MTIRDRELPIRLVAIELALAWILGSTAALLLHLASEDRLGDFELEMLLGTLGWSGLVIVPLFFVAWFPLALFRDKLQFNGATLVVFSAVVGLSLYALTRPESGDPYTKPFLQIIGAAGLSWVVIVTASMYSNRRRHGDAE